VCGGYDTARIFVNSGQEHGDANTRRFMPGSYSTLSLIESKTQTLPQYRPAILPPPVRLMLERSLERGALESKYFDVYWTSLLPNGQIFSPQAARYSTAGWTGVVQDLCQRDDLVRLALLANALGLLGQHSGQQPIIMEGWRMYGRSLQVLAQSLPAMSQGSDRVLTTSMLLAQYQVCRSICPCRY
jgi:hypothetical protein